MKTSTKLFCFIAMLMAIGCNNRDHALQALPKVGEIAPDFTLRNDQGGETGLSDFRGKKMVVLYFYPKERKSEWACGASHIRIELVI